MKVRQELIRYFSPSTPPEDRLAVASRQRPSELEPWDELTVLFILGFDKDRAVAEAAARSLEEYPPERLLSALERRLDPLVIKKALEMSKGDDAVRIMAALNPGVDDATLAELAETGPEEAVAALAGDRALLAARPFLEGAIRKNPCATAALRAAMDEALQGGGPSDAAQEQPLHRDLVDEKRAKVDEHNLYAVVSQMSMGQKLKLALSGNKAARELLIKDSNKMISMSVLKNPKITEDEVHRVSASKSTGDDLLRFIGRNKEWMKSYSIRLGLLTNPKTPLAISLKLLEYVYDKDLTGVAKSKNIPSVLAAAARRKIESKGRR